MRAPIAATLCALALCATNAPATPTEPLPVLAARGNNVSDAVPTTFPIAGGIFGPPFFPLTVNFDAGTMSVAAYIGAGSAVINAGNLDVSDVILTMNVGYANAAEIRIPGAASVTPFGFINLVGGQTVTIVTALTTIELAISGLSNAMCSPVGAFYIQGTYGAITDTVSAESVTVAHPAFYYAATNTLALSVAQQFGSLVMSSFTTATLNLTTGIITVVDMLNLTNATSGAVYTFTPGVSSAFLPANLLTTAAVAANMPGGSAVLAGAITHDYPAAVLSFPQPIGSSVSVDMLTGIATFTFAGLPDVPTTFVTSSLGPVFGTSGVMQCTLSPLGALSCNQLAGTTMDAAVNGGDLAIWLASEAITILTDGTSTSAGPAHFLTGEMAVVGGNDGWNLSAEGVLTLFGSTEVVSDTETLLVDASAARFPNTVGSLSTLTGVFTIIADSTVTSEQGFTIDAINGGTIVRNGLVLTVTLNAGAVMPLTALANDQFHVVLAAGTWVPGTGCFAMAQGSTFTVVNTLTDAPTATVVLPAPGLLCMNGVVTNPLTGAPVGYITFFGTWKTGPAPPANIPANCMNMTTGMMILLQQGGYDNALATCATYSLEALDVTVENIDEATELLTACGGLVKSVYVGAFNGTNDGGCIALYTGSTVGSGTVAAAPCASNRPVMCLMTP